MEPIAILVRPLERIQVIIIKRHNERAREDPARIVQG